MNYELRIKNIVLIAMALFLIASPFVQAAEPTLNPFSPNFKLSICDGPADMPNQPANYTPCDFNGLMKQIRFLINAMIVLGVLGAVVSFTYAGTLYLSGQKGKIDQAKDIFKKVGIGFIIMLTAWFIVYQILTWLIKDAGIKSLLGSP